MYTNMLKTLILTFDCDVIYVYGDGGDDDICGDVCEVSSLVSLPDYFLTLILTFDCDVIYVYGDGGDDDDVCGDVCEISSLVSLPDYFLDYL